MDFFEYFPFSDKLSENERQMLITGAVFRKIKKGTVIHGGSKDCMGLILICSGQLRVYMVSNEGKEVTIYRLLERDTCLLSASCMMRSIQFDIAVAAEKDTEAWIIPIDTYRPLMESSAAVANYTTELLCARFTETMWLVEQILWRSIDKRLASFILEECSIENTNTLHITHEQIASHIGTAREVVTRTLKSFHDEGIVKNARGEVMVMDMDKLKAAAK